jgi:hypothetical protein
MNAVLSTQLLWKLSNVVVSYGMSSSMSHSFIWISLGNKFTIRPQGNIE